MFVKLKNWLREYRLSLRMKMTLSFSAIAVVLLMSSVISILEYRHMSNYVSTMIASDIRNIHVTQNMVDAVDAYNLRMLAVIGDDGGMDMTFAYRLLKRATKAANCSRVEDNALILTHSQSFIEWSYDGDDGGRAQDEHVSSSRYWSSPPQSDDDGGGM